MIGPRARLAILVVALLAGFAAFWGFDVVTKEDVRGWVDAFGPFAPVAYVPISALLGLLLVPGPVLAGVSGLLFGTAVGTIVTLSASVLSAVCALLVARHVGREGAVDLGGERLARAERLLERHGFGAVVLQRLLPAVPDAPMNYAFGVLGVAVWQIALGTAIGAAPRAFSYTAIGASLDDPSSPAAIAGVVVLVLVSFVGAEIARRIYVAR
ncbi:hypothetical protein GKE82_11500 [Conexibacter sp. W3-3-2]|uniref:TVP38/TMEM64 family membrane protein n=1 Tax=Paraconexibacter algicola TaxID=2133960 RepID=A0A2T4UHB4_9ACTN|nr:MULTISPECIES: VTT domain-containing protein [Solirubrobacterales]MTD44899.1 hypothetical protein [Conexibacter sp. W3-3-2]PTL58607.1 hypothetical protein C7Y72_02505 [Paraconexibacter algicola]